MEVPLKQLGQLSLEDFFARYWQKKAVYLRQVLPGFRSPLTPDELAGLALEEDVESRLVIHSDSAPWQLRQGPFSEEDFAALDAEHWTLLVQAVDQWVPEVAALLDAFRFIPNWRLDDIMVSYAPTGGSVGPHFDYYDVFLLQGAGRRRWQLGEWCDSHTPRLAGTPLNILRDFTAGETVDLEPGDILYIPPGLAHWGTALDDDCMTYSIGFRAPSHADILTGISQSIATALSEDVRYTDQLISATTAPGEIDASTVSHLQHILRDYLTPAAIARWFGRTVSEPKYPDLLAEPPALTTADYSRLRENNALLEHTPGARFCYVKQADNADACTLFVAGKDYTCATATARLLCEQPHFTLAHLETTDNPGTIAQLLLSLLNNGVLLFDLDL